MNYLAYVIKESTQFCLRRMMIHNFFPCTQVEEVINSGLIHVDKWYNENGMKKNHSKYQAMVMVKYKKSWISLRKYSYSNCWRDGAARRFCDDKLKFDKHVKLKYVGKWPNKLPCWSESGTCYLMIYEKQSICHLLFHTSIIAPSPGIFAVKVLWLNLEKLMKGQFALFLKRKALLIANFEKR